MSTNYFIQKSFVMGSGERYCLLVDRETGLPLYYPNLFCTTQVRNASLSYSAMCSALGGIATLLRFMEERNEDIEMRFGKYEFFEVHELDAIRDYCQSKFRVRTMTPDPNGVFSLKELREVDAKVNSQTEYVRLTVISQYVNWLSKALVGSKGGNDVSQRVAAMTNGLIARRPLKQGRNSGLVEKGLDSQQLDMLFEIIRPGSDLNPIINKSVQVRNRLIILLLYHLGIRGGELLNIRIKDIDFNNNQLVIVRRADQKDDPRADMPLVKTLDRRIPMKDTLVKEIHNYILQHRKKIVRKGLPDYLIVTHKNGPTKGHPLSKSGYEDVISVVKKVSPALYNLTGHQLRHVWNEKFSDLMDSMDEPPDLESQENSRSDMMGWRRGSGTAATYNKRFIKKKAVEASLKLQENMMRLPKGLKNEEH